MKRLLLSLLMLVMVSGISTAIPQDKTASGHLYIEIEKAVNGDQVWGLPVFEMNIARSPLLIDVEFRNNFTSPRGKIMSFPNHLSSKVDLHLGYISKTNSWITFSLGVGYMYAGNDYKLPSGLFFDNKLRFGYSW